MKKYLNTFNIFNDLSENEIELFTSKMKTIKYKKMIQLLLKERKGIPFFLYLMVKLL